MSSSSTGSTAMDSLSSVRMKDRELRHHERSNRVDDLLLKMTLQDKIGQMSQVDLPLILNDDGSMDLDKIDHYFGELGVGSILNTFVGEPWTASQYRQVAIAIQNVTQRYERPPVIWGLDSVHGANYVHGAIVSPQPIHLAATFNTSMAYRAGVMASRDTRAAGISWLFSPLLGIALEPKWSRVYETFGEDPHIVGQMARAMMEGIQEKDDSSSGSNKTVPSRAAACAKHFVGYSKPINGHDRSPSWIPTRHLYQYFVPPWKQVSQEVLTVMESYTEVDGVPNAANHVLLQDLLRRTLQFEGVLVTDYEEIRNLHNWHHIVSQDTDAIAHSLQETSIDMSMIPYDVDGFNDGVQQGLTEGLITPERLDESVRRILHLKETLRMMDETLTMENGNMQVVGTGREEALKMAQDGLILVKNEGLPLTGTKKILVTGPTADSLAYQSGGWTWQWQGTPEGDDPDKWFTYGSTVLGALQNETDWTITYRCGTSILGTECDDDHVSPSGVVEHVEDWVGLGGDGNSIDRAKDAASGKDVLVVCLGEENYTEKPGDIRDLALPQGQYDLVKQLRHANSNAKLVLVYFGGRPRLLKEAEENADAVILGFLPGPDAGQALADVMSGRVNPSGRLPITYPKYQDGGGTPYFHTISDQCTAGNENEPLPHWEYVPCEVQWPFGHGISYTNFEYTTGVTVSSNDFVYHALGTGDSPTIQMSVRVKNSGSVAGAETVLFFTFDEFRSTTPEYKRLRAFEKVYLEPGEEVEVTADLGADDLRFIGPHDDTHRIVEHGMRFRVGVGAHTDCRGDDLSNLCSDFVTVNAGDDYIGACEAACDLWSRSSCSSDMSPNFCWRLCTSPNVGGTDGWGWNYVKCIEGLQGIPEDDCWKMTTLCRNVFLDPDHPPVENGGAGPLSAAHVIVALLAGLASALLVIRAMRGGLVKREDEEHVDVQFTRVAQTVLD